MQKKLMKVWLALKDERGSNMGEYAAIGALVLLVAVGAFMALGGRISGLIEAISGAI